MVGSANLDERRVDGDVLQGLAVMVRLDGAEVPEGGVEVGVGVFRFRDGSSGGSIGADIALRRTSAVSVTPSSHGSADQRTSLPLKAPG